MAIPKVWAKIQPLDAISLLDITTEQRATKMQEREYRKLQNQDSITTNGIKANKGTNETYDVSDISNDEVIANLLQDQFNQEYDTMLKRTEKKFNRNSKDEDCIDSDDSNKDFDRFVRIEKEYASIPRCGYKKIGNGSQIITKHDTLMSSRMNACRVLQFPPGIQTGDTGGFDVKLNNKVFNTLRAHSHAQYSRQRAKVLAKSKTHSK